MRKVSRRAKEEGVSPVIATILMVAITVVLAAVLYVIVSNMMHTVPPPRNIAVACTKISSTTSYKCTIASADNAVDFTQVGVQVRSGGTTVANWSTPIQYVNGEKQSYLVASPVANGKIVDNGDGKFGIGDDVYLAPVANQSLVGLEVKVSGTGGDGFTTI
jgi:flagellin-like protein